MGISADKINAMITLLDDEDETIVHQIENSIKDIGVEALPYLEDAWASLKLGEVFRQRIENLVHEIQYTDLSASIVRWAENRSDDLLEGLILLNKYQFPDLDANALRKRVNNLFAGAEKSIDKGFNPKQQLAQLNKYLFHHLGFQGDTKDYYSPKNNILNYVLQRKKGNPLSLSIIYLLAAKRANIPLVGVNLPRHFLLGYKSDFGDLEFFVSPFNRGTFLNVSEVHDYLRKINLSISPKYYSEASNLDILKRVMLNLINSYNKERKKSKAKEIQAIYNLIKPLS